MEEQTKSSPYLPKTWLKHRFNQFRTRCAYLIFKRIITKYRPSYQEEHFKLLDTGCGPGYLLHFLKSNFPKIELNGVDMDNGLLNFSNNFNLEVNLKLSNAETLPFDDNTFDVLTCLQVVEHLEHPEHFFLEAKRVLKPNGLMIITTPNPSGYGAKIMGEKWVGIRFDHISLKPPDEWRAMIQNSFQLIRDGSTFLSGIPLFRYLPFSIINWTLLLLLGYLPWLKGESYIAIAERPKK